MNWKTPKQLPKMKSLTPGAVYTNPVYDKFSFVGMNCDGEAVFDFGDLCSSRYSTFGPGLAWQNANLQLLSVPGDYREMPEEFVLQNENHKALVKAVEAGVIAQGVMMYNPNFYEVREKKGAIVTSHVDDGIIIKGPPPNRQGGGQK